MAFDPSITGFSYPNALYMALASQAAELGTANSSFDTLGLSGIKESNWNLLDTYYFTGFGVGYQLLSFRGTILTDINNDLTDLDCAQVPDRFGNGYVHRGFSNALSAVWPALLGQIEPKVPLWITGHSLGAALATLASQWLSLNGFQVAGVYTFGSPRVGNVAFARSYSPTQYRVVNIGDPVPSVPVPVMFIPPGIYQHVGTLESIGTLAIPNISHHHITEYIGNIRRLINATTNS